jgi:hypothetical protein
MLRLLPTPCPYSANLSIIIILFTSSIPAEFIDIEFLPLLPELFLPPCCVGISSVADFIGFQQAIIGNTLS